MLAHKQGRWRLRARLERDKRESVHQRPAKPAGLRGQLTSRGRMRTHTGVAALLTHSRLTLRPPAVATPLVRFWFLFRFPAAPGARRLPAQFLNPCDYPARAQNLAALAHQRQQRAGGARQRPPETPPDGQKQRRSCRQMHRLVFRDQGVEGAFAIHLQLRGRRLALALCSVTLLVSSHAPPCSGAPLLSPHMLLYAALFKGCPHEPG